MIGRRVAGKNRSGPTCHAASEMSTSRHDHARDHIAANWSNLRAFVCAGCGDEKRFPSEANIVTEAAYGGGLRADIAAVGIDGQVMGIVEVIDRHGPSDRALEEQRKLDFAYYRLLNVPKPPKRRNVADEIALGRFRYPDDVRNGTGDPVWLCSPDCLGFFIELKGADRTNAWDAPRCDVCRQYLHDNPLSQAEFRDWAYDPYTAFCIHCAAHCNLAEMQWRAPGELAGGDPREWTPDDEADPVILFLAFCEAAFWSKVWSSRVAKLNEPGSYDGGQRETAENATVERLLLVNAAFEVGDWAGGANLLLPVGAPGWARYEDEPERLLAFRPDNCRRTAAAWRRLLSYRLTTLPEELATIIEERSALREAATGLQHCNACGAENTVCELETGATACVDCGTLYG